LNPGRHRIDASADQKLPFVQEITLAASQKVDVTLPALDDLPSGASSAPPPYSPPPADVPSGSEELSTGPRFGIWPYALMGGGGAVFVTGMVTGLIANSKANELEDQCTDTNADGQRICDPSLRDTKDSAENLATVTDVLWISGLVVAGVGVTLFILDSQAESPAPALEAGCFAGGCGLRAFGQF
jgi:hypothetical protein